jgi:hypothetical protein
MDLSGLTAGLGLGITGLTIVLGCGITAATLGFIAVVWFVTSKITRRMTYGDSELMKNGIPAQGQILRAWDTGVRIGGDMNIRVGMELEVRPPTGDPYRVETAAVIPMFNMSSFQVGALVPVKISPTDPGKVHLDIYQQR